MQVGVIGLPGCGKTTVFRALTGLPNGADSSPRARLVHGVVKVPDERLDKLAEMYHPKKLTRAELRFTDVPGPGPSADGQGPVRSIPARFLADMRSMDVLIHVVRAFESPTLGHPDPVADLDSLREEMILADLEVVERRLGRLAKGEKSGFTGEKEALDGLMMALGEGRSARNLHLNEELVGRLSGFAFLTLKPEIVVVSRDDAAAGTPLDGDLGHACLTEARAVVPLCARLETELGELEPGERELFMKEMGIESAGTDVFLREVYAALGLVSFFTTGEDEVRAWTIRSGTTALEAAGKIHTDLMRGFIRADVVAYDDLVALGDEASCRRAGKLKQEGKDYVVSDGEILTIKFNV